MLLGLLYRIIGDFSSYIGDIGDIGGTTMAGLLTQRWMSGMKPMSSMRSASSSTRYFRLAKLT